MEAGYIQFLVQDKTGFIILIFPNISMVAIETVTI